MVRQSTLEASDLIGRDVPLLAAATPLIGHFQIRNRGTIGGSIAHADPAAEYPAVMLALDAEIVVSRAAGRAHRAGWRLLRGDLGNHARPRTSCSTAYASRSGNASPASPWRRWHVGTETSPSPGAPVGCRSATVRSHAGGDRPVRRRRDAGASPLRRSGPSSARTPLGSMRRTSANSLPTGSTLLMTSTPQVLFGAASPLRSSAHAGTGHLGGRATSF